MPSTPARLGLLVAGTALLLGGCTTTYQVQVDAISQATPAAASAQSYEIQSNDPRVDPESLRHKEVASYVKTALSGKGMYEAPPGVKADVVVSVDYGMEPPRVKYETETFPIFAQVGGGVRYVQMPVTDRNGRVVGYHRSHRIILARAAARRVALAGRPRQRCALPGPEGSLWVSGHGPGRLSADRRADRPRLPRNSAPRPDAA